MKQKQKYDPLKTCSECGNEVYREDMKIILAQDDLGMPIVPSNWLQVWHEACFEGRNKSYAVTKGDVVTSNRDIILCKCGHPIEIVGTKWQHIELLSLKGKPFDEMPKGEIKYRERCYHCDCATPIPVEE